MPAISAVLITRNEAHNLPRCLASLAWADEVLVVDSGSEDGTPQLAESLGARVIHQDFLGYGPQKAFAVSQARHDWVFSIDADEEVSEGLQASLLRWKAAESPAVSAIWITRWFYFLGQRIRFGGVGSERYIRLFDRRRAGFNDLAVHESVQVQTGEQGHLSGPLFHYSYRDIDDYFHKFNRYTSLAAESLFRQGKKKSLVYLVLRQPISFLQLFVLKGLFLDGYPGFVWALLSSFYPVVKYIKLRDLYRRQV